MVIVAAHRHFGANVLEQLGGDARVFGEDPVGATKRVCGARREVAEIADRRCDDVQPGEQALTHGRRLTSSNSTEKESSCRGLIGLRRGTMIALLAASAVYLTGL